MVVCASFSMLADFYTTGGFISLSLSSCCCWCYASCLMFSLLSVMEETEEQHKRGMPQSSCHSAWCGVRKSWSSVLSSETGSSSFTPESKVLELVVSPRSSPKLGNGIFEEARKILNLCYSLSHVMMWLVLVGCWGSCTLASLVSTLSICYAPFSE